MIVTGWSNGNHNSTTSAGGYGIRIRRADRDRYFKEDWTDVVIVFDNGHEIRVHLSPSFWQNCPELRSKEIGKWMISKNIVPWERNNPPMFILEYLNENKFILRERINFKIKEKVN